MFDLFGRCSQSLSEFGLLAFQRVKTLTQTSPISHAYVGSELLEPFRILAVSDGFRSLRPNCSKPTLNLLHDIRESEHILVDTSEATLSLDLLGFETTHARGFFKDRPSVLR